MGIFEFPVAASAYARRGGPLLPARCPQSGQQSDHAQVPLVISIIGGCVAALFSGVVIAFWRRSALKTVELQAQIVELRGRGSAIECSCADRLTWNRTQESKLDKVASDTHFIPRCPR